MGPRRLRRLRWSRRHPHNSGSCRYVANHDGAGGNHTHFSHEDILYDDSAGSNLAASTDRHTASEDCSGGDMNMIAEHAVVIDARTGVDDSIAADPAVGLEDDAGQNLARFTDSNPRPGLRPRINDGREAESRTAKPIEYASPFIGPFAESYAVDQKHISRVVGERGVVVAEDPTDPDSFGAWLLLWRYTAKHRRAKAGNGIRDHSGMPAGTDHDHWPAHAVTGSS